MSVQRIALVGNPNSGKTALFNLLTGSRQKVGNYPGVTVERKSGRLATPSGRNFEVLDLPGAYTLTAASPDEEITRDICLGRFSGEKQPDAIICVADATNLRLHLRFVLELQRLGLPMILALNMSDAARRRGIRIDVARLEKELGIPVVETVAVQRGGAAELISRMEKDLPTVAQGLPADADLHAKVKHILDTAVVMPRPTASLDEAIDRIVLHPVAGLVILSLVMFFMFQAVFAWAAPFMNVIDSGIEMIGGFVGGTLPEGPLRGLLVEGIIAGVGSVIIFLPQILFLFLFILILEESGYLPRAAFLLDRMMVGAGLTGRSFIPLLSSFACAIPGIMAARTIQDPRDRITTILVAPLMTCSARLPVYTLLIAAFIPQTTVLGMFHLGGVVLFGLYIAGIVGALIVAYVMKHLRRDRHEHALMLELPSYRLPHPRDIAIGLWERARLFMARVGKIILSITVILWFLSSYPTPPPEWTGTAIDYSLAGRIGHAVQWLFAPIGFTWEICIALIPGLAAREVAVSALGTVYAISAAADDATSQLLPIISSQWSLATGMSLIAWYVFAPQCLATLAVMHRETNSWGVVATAVVYLFGLAYLASFITFQVVSLVT
ncbi:MAG: ferrous iron transporter B [Betaproteobacteria bacterium]|jgi:ferrous iron transport protein B|nr:MAG: ferrous iron transporter B [Betaproteobacteria bacterium]